MTSSHQKSVIVIGAGVIGCSIAYALCRRGVRTVTVEANGQPFSGSSASAFGSLTPFSDPYFSGPAREYARKGVHLYRTDWLAGMGCTPEQISFTDLGLIELRKTESNDTSASDFSRRLTLEEVRLLEPHLGSAFSSAVLHDEPWFDAHSYYSVLRKVLADQEAHSFELGTEAISVASNSSGCAVTLSTGETKHSDWVVVASGLNERIIDGVPLMPLSWIRGDAIRVQHPLRKNLLQRHVYFDQGFITPRSDGALLLGATYVEEDNSAVSLKLPSRHRISVDAAQNLLASNVQILPELLEFDIVETFRGWRPATSDNLPILGAHDQFPRVVIANGFIGLGVTMAPAVADDVAEFIVGNAVRFPTEFAPNRFEFADVGLR